MLHQAFLPVLEISISLIVAFIVIAFIDYAFFKPLTIELNRRLAMESQIAQRRYNEYVDMNATDPFALYLEEKDLQIEKELQENMFTDKEVTEEGSFDKWLTTMFQEWLQDNQVNCYDSFDQDTKNRLWEHWLKTETELA